MPKPPPGFEWDEAKAASNWRKHGVSFAAVEDFDFQPLSNLREAIMKPKKTAPRYSVSSAGKPASSYSPGVRESSASSVFEGRQRKNGASTSKRKGIDPDNPPLTDAQLKRMRPISNETLDFINRARGRPQAEEPKLAVSIRLDPDVIAHFKQAGPGWQSRINAALRKAAKLGRK